MSPKEELAKRGRLTYISPLDIERNPHNPRLLFDPEPVQILKKSIDEVGILVPLLIYQRKIDGEYIILDGERRWICAKELGLEKVPVNIIAEPTNISNILTMFHIHQVREPWELTPTALKLEVVMKILKTRDIDKLSKLTGLSEWNVKRCQTLLSFSKKYLDMTLVGDTTERIKGDFFVELYSPLELIKQKFPKIYSKYSREGIIDRMLEKYKLKKIKAVTEFRDLTKLVRAVEKGAPYSKIEQIIVSIIENPEIGIRDTFKGTTKILYEVEKLEKICIDFNKSLTKLNINEVDPSSTLVDTLKELKVMILI